jgi:hypothetical protein
MSAHQAPDYTIKIWFDDKPGLHPWAIKITNRRYQNEDNGSQEFYGKSIRSLLRQAADWTVEH